MCETSTGLSVCGCVALVTAEGFISANRSPSQKFFKHLDHCSEQLFFQTHEHFCVCTVTDCGQTRNQVEWTSPSVKQGDCFLVTGSSLNLMWFLARGGKR